MVERRDQILDERVELSGRDTHPRVRLFHVAARVRRGTAGRLRHLIDEHLLQTRDIRAGELPVDPIVRGAPGDEVLHDRRDGPAFPEAFVQRGCQGPHPLLINPDSRTAGGSGAVRAYSSMAWPPCNRGCPAWSAQTVLSRTSG